MQITTIGLDIAKNVFQVHGIDAAEKVIIRKQLRRGQVMAFFEALAPCLVGMEACATSPHWARELTKLGHEVRLMPAKDVKAYVKRNKNDAADAEAICEAVRRPTMRFVRIKSAEQQGQLMLHRARDLLMRQRTQLINALRAHLAEFGAKIRPRLFVTQRQRRHDRFRRSIGMAGSKWRIGIVLETQLDTLRHRVTGEIGHHSQAKIDTGCNTARRNQVTVLHDTLLFVCRANQRQQLRKRPVRGCAATSKQSGGTQNEGAGANRGHVLRFARLPLHECNGLLSPIA